MGKKNNKRKQKHSQKMMADSQISQKQQQALKMGMTMEQYEKHMKMQQQIWEEQQNKEAQKQQEEDQEEEEDQNAIPKLNPGENFKAFDAPSYKNQEVKGAKLQFQINKNDIDPDKLAAKQKILEMLENESDSEEDQDQDILKNLNQQGSQGQEKSTRAQRELGGDKNEKLAAQIKSDLDRLNQVKKRRELAAKKREQEKARKLAQQKKKEQEEAAVK